MSEVVLAGGQHGQSSQPTAVQYAGAPARVDLLPEEIQREAAVRATRRAAVYGVIVALVVAAGGYVYALGVASGAQGQLADAQSQTSSLQRQRAGSATIRQLQQKIAGVTSVENVVD